VTTILTASTRRARAIGALLPALATVALVVVFSLSSPYFLDAGNLQNLFIDASTLLICAFGMTLVILVGEIDLSVGAVCSLLTIVLATMLVNGVPWPLAAGMIALLGIIVSAIMGAVTIVGQVPSFIVTLGAMSVATGLSYSLTGSIAVPITDEGFFSALYFATLLGVPAPTLIVALAFVAVLVFQKRTALGREFVAVGINREAARLSGIVPGRVRMFAFLAMGALVGVGAVLAAARLGSGAPNSFPTLTLDVIAAVVIGGASLTGGRAFITRTLLGGLLIATLNNGLTLLNINSDYQYVIKGVIILAAVLVDRSTAKGDG